MAQPDRPHGVILTQDVLGHGVVVNESGAGHDDSFPIASEGLLGGDPDASGVAAGRAPGLFDRDDPPVGR